VGWAEGMVAWVMEHKAGVAPLLEIWSFLVVLPTLFCCSLHDLVDSLVLGRQPHLFSRCALSPLIMPDGGHDGPWPNEMETQLELSQSFEPAIGFEGDAGVG
jgi:hypothetical protein